MQQKDLISIGKKFQEQKAEDFLKKDVSEFWKIIQAHGDLYYKKESPLISDKEYDDLFQKYSEVKKYFWEEVSIGEKTWEFGQSSFQKVAHSRPMISLDNTYNAEDLRDFDIRVKRILQDNRELPYTIEFKFDGLGVELIYKDWEFIQAITRGNGIEWEDVTENVRQIVNVPKRIEKKWRFEVRGEVVMPISSFERLNTEARKLEWKIFANPRNAASGSLRVLDSSITKSRDLKYFAYDVSDYTRFQWKYSDMIYHLESLGFEISSYFPECHGIESVIQEITQAENVKNTIDFEIDGLVIKVNNLDLWWEIGSTEHHPRYAISYKFPAEISTTQIESIEHSVGRTGTITPVANVSPVNLWGAVIRRSTLHNYEEIEKLDVREGDRVFIKRAGEVIPKIISVVTDARDGNEKMIETPKVCPSCGELVFKDEDKVRYYCNNKISCPAQMKEQLAHSVGKNGLDIDGLWERQIEIFLEHGFIKSLADIFFLSERRAEILELEWFQEKSVDKLLASIEQAKNMDVVKFLRSIGIPGVGKKTAKTLSQCFITHDDISQFSLNIDVLEELPDIWPEVAKSVVEFFQDRNWSRAELALIKNITFSKKTDTSKWKYSWKKMCITGSFEWYSRDQLIEILESQGWEFVSSVSKNTDYLLAWEKAGGKLKKAENLGVEVLKLDQFL